MRCPSIVAVLVGLMLLAATAGPASAQPPAAPWKAGTASVPITPEGSLWMAGYAARTKPSEGKAQDLFAKALALEDPAGSRLVIVTLDLIGVPRSLRDHVARQAQARYRLPPEALLLNASHTHCGPVVRAEPSVTFDLSAEQVRGIEDYVAGLQDKLAALVGKALDGLAPARLGYSHARAGFAMNRRLPTDKGYQNSPHPDGPVDHDVPVLRVEGADGKLRAVLFGYACHNTTLSFYQFCGDYAGFAQQYLEEAHPGTVALFLTGCGGDQNPYPRGTLELARQHGRALANAVEAALLPKPKPVRGPLGLALEEVTLDFVPPAGRDELLKRRESADKYEQRKAKLLLDELEKAGRIGSTYSYPIQLIRFGGDLTLVALAGEVVVDYALRLKRELPGAPLWVAGYSNDVFGYVPSLRVLKEGGYEGGDAFRYNTLPGPFAPSVEERVVGKVHELAKKVPVAGRKNDRPNVVVILADDLGYADLGVHGGKEVATPHLDALAKEGVRCTSGYVSGPYCSPTRAGLLTGRYQQRFGHEFNPALVRQGGTGQGLPGGETTLAARLQAAGYATGLVGKWHLGEEEPFHPLRRGFTEFFGFLPGAHSYFQTDDATYGPIYRGRQRVELDGYLTDVLAREAAAFIDRHRQEPFFLYLAFNAVHTPLHAPEPLLKRFADVADPTRRTYLAMVASLDEAVGTVLGKLRAAGLEEDTLVFFLSDNGGPVGKFASNGSRNGPLRGSKGDTWEGGIRVPFLVRWKGRLPAGKVYDHPIISLDIAPTALVAAGVESRPEWQLDGVNLLPFLDGKNDAAPHEALFWRFGAQMAVRQGDWKLVRPSRGAREYEDIAREPLLFDLAADAGEKDDLAAKRPDKVRALQAAWDRWNATLAEPRWPATVRGRPVPIKP